MKPDYSAVDAAILERIRSGAAEFMFIHAHEVVDAIKALPAEVRNPEFRVVDRRLQALRKAGRIKCLARVGWQIVKAG